MASLDNFNNEREPGSDVPAALAPVRRVDRGVADVKPHVFALLGVALCAALTLGWFVALVLRFAAEVNHGF